MNPRNTPSKARGSDSLSLKKIDSTIARSMNARS